MKRTKKVQFNVLKQDVTVELQPKRRGVYWNYSDVPFNYGPFKSDDQAINDANHFFNKSGDLLIKTLDKYIKKEITLF